MSEKKVNATEDLGEEIDRLDNVLNALNIPMPDAFHLQQVKQIIPDIIANMKKHYEDMTGEQIWNF